MRSEMRIELARGERQQRCWEANADGAVDRQCGGGKVMRNAFGKEAKAGQGSKKFARDAFYAWVIAPEVAAEILRVARTHVRRYPTYL
jgi:hypothetical protein